MFNSVPTKTKTPPTKHQQLLLMFVVLCWLDVTYHPSSITSMSRGNLLRKTSSFVQQTTTTRKKRQYKFSNNSCFVPYPIVRKEQQNECLHLSE